MTERTRNGAETVRENKKKKKRLDITCIICAFIGMLYLLNLNSIFEESAFL